MEKPSNAKSGTNKRRKASHLRAKYSGPSYSDLPSNVLESIILRLSIKRIFICKCVCKTWHGLISDPGFAKLHFDQAQPCPLIQTSGFNVLSRMLYLVQPDQEDFELKLDCPHSSPEHNLGCACNVKVKLDTKFRLPLRNFQKIVNDKNDGKSNNCLKLNMRDHKYSTVNSCNGLLCLRDPFDKEPMVVCNPVTGEFIYVPKERINNISDTPDIACGFGFSPVSKQYKVVRIYDRCSSMVAEVHVLGSKSWKQLGYFPYSTYKLKFMSYLNGYLYWYSPSKGYVIFFDIEKDRFGWFYPPLSRDCHRLSFPSIGALGGELCISKFVSHSRFNFWVKKDCNGKKDWIKMLTIDMEGKEKWPQGSYQPMKYLNNGALLLYNYQKSAFLYYDPKKLGYRYMKIRGMTSNVEFISHIPSFVSLKDAVSGLNATVHNIRSRCGNLKLHKESKRISIVEKNREEIDGWELDGF